MPRQIEVSGELRVQGSPNQTFRFFTPEGERRLDAFVSGFADMLRQWERSIGAVTSIPPVAGQQ
jgi:hypothetical protein